MAIYISASLREHIPELAMNLFSRVVLAVFFEEELLEFDFIVNIV